MHVCWVSGTSRGLMSTSLNWLLSGVPYVVFFDEIDSLTQRRGSTTTSETKLDTMSALLASVGQATHHNLLLLGTTNRKSAIDDALLRSGTISANSSHSESPTLPLFSCTRASAGASTSS